MSIFNTVFGIKTQKLDESVCGRLVLVWLNASSGSVVARLSADVTVVCLDAFPHKREPAEVSGCD